MKKNILKIVYVVICFIVFIVAITNISKCAKKISEGNNEQTFTANVRTQIIDSLKVIYIQEKDSALNRLILIHEKAINKKTNEIAKIKKENKTTEQLLEEKLRAYESDSNAQSKPCNEALDTYKKLVNGKNEEIKKQEERFDSTKVVVEELKSQVVLKDSSFSLVNKMLSNAQDNTLLLEKKLAKKNNWWHRNDFKIGFGSGIAISITAIYIVTRLLR